MSSRTDAVGAAQALLVNSVTLLGVYRFAWPVANALALYWCENVLTTILVIGCLLLWRRKHHRIEDPPNSLGMIAPIAGIFNLAHGIVLTAVLQLMLHRAPPAEHFDRASFVVGLSLVVLLLVAQFVVAARRIGETSSAELQNVVKRWLRRMGVLHFTIILGMGAAALFGGIRAFFLVFALLKTATEVGYPLISRAAARCKCISRAPGCYARLYRSCRSRSETNREEPMIR
jgi:hypothetical protein